jgi:catechol 2,3-dioxygenase-like lactoylglutathione lyase family enzyme
MKSVSKAGRVAIGALATGAFASGARAIGAFAIGAFAIGSFAIRQLAIKRLKIESLEVGNLKVTEIPATKLPAPSSGSVLAHFLTVSDLKRSVRFYTDVLGGEVVLDKGPAFIKLANSWIVLDVGGGPTDDKPDVILHPPTSSRDGSGFLYVGVADIQRFYRESKRKGAEFLAEPVDYKVGIRCFMKDPDGYLIQVVQLTGLLAQLEKAA